MAAAASTVTFPYRPDGTVITPWATPVIVANPGADKLSGK